MKLCLVYSEQDNKLHPKAYTSIFKGMFEALKGRFEEVQGITDNCSAHDIEADLIFFFDPHASHHIEIDDLTKHPALKMELWNDVHQDEMKGHFKTTDLPVHKLGRQQRARRSKERGIDHIIVAAKYLFLELFEHEFDDIEKKMIYHPHAPMLPAVTPFAKREHAIVGNGAYMPNSWRGSYDFRGWAFQQPYVKFVPHVLQDDATPQRDDYIKWLSTYAGAFTGALCPVPKYSEIAAAGCVAFLQYQKEWEEIGFLDHEACVYVRKANFEKEAKAFLANPSDYQEIADRGREIISRYSAVAFADMVYQKAKQHSEHPDNQEITITISRQRPKNVFILNAGRSGSTTFVEACKHITNYTAGHETRAGIIMDRVEYPENHIEVDNRLSWFLGRLDKRYKDNAFYVHLIRDREQTAKSFYKRIGGNASIINAYKNSLIMGGNGNGDWAVCVDYLRTVEDNIDMFLKDKTHKMVFGLEEAKKDFKQFWQAIGAEGDIERALSEFDIAHNKSAG